MRGADPSQILKNIFDVAEMGGELGLDLGEGFTPSGAREDILQRRRDIGVIADLPDAQMERLNEGLEEDHGLIDGGEVMQAGFGDVRKRFERGGGEDIGMFGGMDELEILADELGIEQAAGGEANIPRALRRGRGRPAKSAVRFEDRLAHLADFVRDGFGIALLAQDILDDGANFKAEVFWPCDGSHPSERHMLPDPRFIVLVFVKAFEHHGDGSGLSGRAQTHIDIIKWRRLLWLL